MYTDTARERDDWTKKRIAGMLVQTYYNPHTNDPTKIVLTTADDAEGRPSTVLSTPDGNYLVGRISRVEAKVDGLVAGFQAFVNAGGNSTDLSAISSAVDTAVNNAFDERIDNASVVLQVNDGDPTK